MADRTSSTGRLKGKSVSPNRLLASLAAREYRRLLPSFKVEPLVAKQILQSRNKKVTAVYFPSGGVCSVTTVMNDGRMVEVATIGNEGMVGAMAFLAEDEPLGECMVQVPIPDMSAQVMSISAFKQEMDQRTALYDIVQRWSRAFFSMVMKTVGCNGMHTVEKRTARWLLQTHDRVKTDELILTHEFLSMMLGVRRPAVTLAAGALKRAGLVAYRRERITILDRAGLEDASCECYRAIRNQFDRLLG